MFNKSGIQNIYIIYKNESANIKSKNANKIELADTLFFVVFKYLETMNINIFLDTFDYDSGHMQLNMWNYITCSNQTLALQ